MVTLLTPREVDQLLRYPRGRSVKLAKAGNLPAVFLPNDEIRFQSGVIDEWISERSRPGEEVGNGPALATQ